MVGSTQIDNKFSDVNLAYTALHDTRIAGRQFVDVKRELPMISELILSEEYTNFLLLYI